jgi:hypothetical protein
MADGKLPADGVQDGHAHRGPRRARGPGGGDAITRCVRATTRGSFVVSFAGIEACGGIEGVATGSRGSHASFQSSSLIC